MSDHSTQEPTEEIPYGYCHCGCGQKTTLAIQTHSKYGYIKGEPLRYIVGHVARVRAARPVAERFWEKVDKRGPDDCWEWMGARDANGYGKLTVGSKRDGNKRTILAHRLCYELTSGPIPEGSDVLHRCDNPPCNNPAHLFEGTAQDNISDMISKGREDFSGLEKGWRLKRAQKAPGRHAAKTPAARIPSTKS